MAFVATQSYTFRVFNRLGARVFETNDVSEGWDGTFKGQSAKQGVYVYVIQFLKADGMEFLKRGTVMLVK